MDESAVFDEELLQDVLEQGHSIGFRSVSISGGEPFLFVKLLIRVIKKAKDLKYGVRIATNGFWGKTGKSANNVLSRLADAGFSPPRDSLVMSVGEFHQEWIPRTSARNIIKYYGNTFGLPFEVDFESSKGKEHMLEDFIHYLDSEGISKESYKLTRRMSIAPLGRGKNLADDSIRYFPGKAFKKCNWINAFVLQPGGDVVPCCGLNRFNPGISLGNVRDNSVAEIIRMASDNVIYRYLKQAELGEIYSELSQRFVLRPEFASGCELCEALFSKQAHVAHLAEIAPLFLGDRGAF